MEQSPDDLPSFLKPKQPARGAKRAAWIMLKLVITAGCWIGVWALNDMGYRGVPLSWQGLRWWFSLWW